MLPVAISFSKSFRFHREYNMSEIGVGTSSIWKKVAFLPLVVTCLPAFLSTESLQLHISNAPILCLSLTFMVHVTRYMNIENIQARIRRLLVVLYLPRFLHTPVRCVTSHFAIAIGVLTFGTQLQSLNVPIIYCSTLILFLFTLPGISGVLSPWQ